MMYLTIIGPRSSIFFREDKPAYFAGKRFARKPHLVLLLQYQGLISLSDQMLHQSLQSFLGLHFQIHQIKISQILVGDN